MLRQTSFAGPGVTSAAKVGRIHGLAATSERCRLVPAKLVSRFRNCAARPSRRRSTLLPAGELSRGSADRGVSGGDFGSAGGEDITEALWGTRVSPSTVSNLNKMIYAKIKGWRNRRIEGEHPYLYLDGIVMKRSRAGEDRNVSLWWPARSTLKDFARFSASARAPRRTSPVGRRFCDTWSIAASRACS